MHHSTVLVCGIVASLMLASCGDQLSSFSRKEAFAPPPPPMVEEMAGGDVTAVGDNPLDVLQRKIIRSAALTVEVDDVQSAAEEAKGIVVKVGGFVADARAAEDDAGRQSVALQLRVPSPRLEEAVKAFSSLGHVREEQTRGEDVTEQVVDLETRLANARRLEARLLELLGKQTKDLKDLLDAERELARVRESIETMEGRRLMLANRTSLATIDLSLIAPPGWGRGIFDPLSGTLQRSLAAFTSSISWLFVVIFAAIPWVGLFLALAWLALRFLRWWIHKKREAKAKKPEPNSIPH